MMIKAVYPGSFDPVTMGHIDIIERATKVVDELVIGVLVNNSKTPMFTLDERVELLKEATKEFKNVRVEKFEGTTIDFAKMNDAKIIIRGLRAVTDFVAEIQIAQTNQFIDDSIDTMFFATSLDYSFLSSSTVKEMVQFGADITGLVPEVIKNRIIEKAKK